MNTQYLRKFRLLVKTFRGQVLDVSSVRFTFKIDKNINRFYQIGEITLYNLSPDTETDIFKNGQEVTLEAGYQDGSYGVIYKGFIRQPIRGKEDGITYFLRLHCMTGDDLVRFAYCNTTINSNADIRTIINQIARSSTIPFDVRIDPTINNSQNTQRAKTVLKSPYDELRSIAENNNSFLYYDDGRVYMSPIAKQPADQITSLNAQTGMIGIPQQTDNGIEVRCLINSAIRLDSWIKLNNQNIIQAQLEFGQILNQVLLDLDGIYRVVSIMATGDSRGNDWYYDLTTISQAPGGNLPLLLSTPAQNGL